MSRVMWAVITVAFVLFIVAMFTSASRTPSQVTGVVQEVLVYRAQIEFGDVGGATRFVGVTIIAEDGTLYRTAFPGELGDVEKLKILPGDSITVKLGRTGYVTYVGVTMTEEKDGTVRITEAGEVGWRLIQAYKIGDRKQGK